jgi:hypothetical protein
MLIVPTLSGLAQFKRYLFMLHCLLFLLFLSSPAFYANGQTVKTTAAAEPNVTWLFDIKENEGTPQGKVYLQVGDRKVLLLPDTAGNYSVLERADYRSHGVPAQAITASTGWWAGQGEDLYVIRRGNQLIVFIRDLDESARVGAYRRLKVIPLH